jgi:hypothetical protein
MNDIPDFKKLAAAFDSAPAPSHMTDDELIETLRRMWTDAELRAERLSRVNARMAASMEAMRETIQKLAAGANTCEIQLAKPPPGYVIDDTGNLRQVEAKP